MKEAKNHRTLVSCNNSARGGQGVGRKETKTGKTRKEGQPLSIQPRNAKKKKKKKNNQAVRHTEISWPEKKPNTLLDQKGSEKNERPGGSTINARV